MFLISYMVKENRNWKNNEKIMIKNCAWETGASSSIFLFFHEIFLPKEVKEKDELLSERPSMDYFSFTSNFFHKGLY